MEIINKKVRWAMSKKVKITLTAITVFILVSIVMFSLVINPAIKYNSAISQMGTQDFDQAISIFNELGNYKNSEKLLIETQYQHAKYKAENEEIDEAIVLFEAIGDYKDSKDLLPDLEYISACEYYDEGHFATALLKFERNPSYKDSDTYIQNAKLLQECEGTWENVKNSSIQIGFLGWHIYSIIVSDSRKTVYDFNYKLENSILKELLGIYETGLVLKISAGYLLKTNSDSEVEKYQKISSSVNITEYDNSPKKPSIGMSKEQVAKSSWGTPSKKNITETLYGTSEQWVYRNKGYIYLDNGVVTSIQTSE